MHLIVGLGNPGPRYADTRHNVGFRVVERLAARWAIPARREMAGAILGDGTVADRHRVVLARPQQFMNCSGQPVASVMGFYKIPAESVTVVYDDLDLPFGRLRVRSGGGHGGHNGIRDILRLVTAPFQRVRVGIGRPPAYMEVADYVLSTWTTEERAGLDAALDRAADAVESLLSAGLERTMNIYNTETTKKNIQ